jgi:DNA-binding transcriptional MerR regulator
MARTAIPAQPALSIGALAAETGCEVQTIRYYEQIGILPKPVRSAGGHRLYTHEQMQRLRFVRRSRDLGFSLDDVKELLRLADNQEANCGAVDLIANRHLREVREKISQLSALEQELKRIARGCRQGKIATCRIVQALSESR